MKAKSQFIRTALTVTLMLLLSSSSFLAGIKDNTSEIILVKKYKTKKIKIKNPITGYVGISPAGLLKGKVKETGKLAKFYCIDLGHPLAQNSYTPYADANDVYVENDSDSNATKKIVYILNSYYPFAHTTIWDKAKEAAAIQCAIWHYSDNFQVEDIIWEFNSYTDWVKRRMQAIIDDTEANFASLTQVKTLIIRPELQKLSADSNGVIYVEAFDLYDNPIENTEINITIEGDATIEGGQYTFKTDEHGIAGPINIIKNDDNSVKVHATAEVMIPHGTMYTYQGDIGLPDNQKKQRIILANPIYDTKKVTSQINWIEDIDLQIVKSVNNMSPSNGDIIEYTIAVKNIGNSTATNIKIKDIFPDGLTDISVTPSENYNAAENTMLIPSIGAGNSAEIKVSAKVNIQTAQTELFSLGEAADFNLFVFEDAVFPACDTEGRMAVGRNTDLANYSVGDKYTGPAKDILLVGNILRFRSGRVYNGNAVYGNVKDISQTNLADGGVFKASDEHPLPDFEKAKSELRKMSSVLSQRVPNGTVEHNWGTLTLKGNDPYLNIFYVEAEQLNYPHTNNVEITVPNGAGALINIAGTGIQWKGGLKVHGTGISNVLYNFYEARDLLMQNIDLQGSILAPWAHVDFVTGVQNGQMICNSIEGQGQFNHIQYIGNVPADSVIANTAYIAELDQVDKDLTNNTSTSNINVKGYSETLIDGGITASIKKWDEVKPSSQATEMAWCTNNDKDGNPLIGTVGGTIYKYIDGNYIPFNSGMNVEYIWDIEVAPSGKIWAATDKGIFSSVDDGYTWEQSQGIKGKDVRAIAFAADNHIYIGTWGEGIYELSKGKFKLISKSIGDALNVTALELDSDGNLYAGTYGNGGLFKYNGKDWEHVNIGYNFVWSLKIVDNTIIVGTYGDGIYYSNNGTNWNRVEGLNSKYIYAVSYINKNLFVSTWRGGVFLYKDFDGNSSLSKANDSDKTWEPIGLVNHKISCIFADKDAHNLYAGTKNGSIYQIPYTKATDVEEINPLTIKEYKLNQNYPNPFNPTTKIEFAVAEEGHYILAVYNILGQYIKTLVDGNLKEGKQTVIFNAEDLSSGIYLYKLTGKKVILVKKMILLK